MLSGSWRIGRIAGIDVRIDLSWIVIVLLVVSSFYMLFAENVAGLSGLAAAAMAIIAALLFFGSLLAHELAHALVAVRRGLEVRSITLFLFGGMTDLRMTEAAIAQEVAIAIVGPLTSAAIGLGLWAVAWLSEPLLPNAFSFLFWYLGLVNLLLAGFNLLPGFPLDGGRILRAIVYRVLGDLRRATQIAANTGQFVSALFVVFGILQALYGNFGGLWLAAIGWFLGRAAAFSYAQTEAQQALASLNVHDVMVRNPPIIPGSLTLDRTVEDYFLHYEDNVFAVGEEEHPSGVLTLESVRAVNRDDWPSFTAADVMAGLEESTVVQSDRSVQELMELLEDRGEEQAFVIDHGCLVGSVSHRDVGRWLRRAREVGLREP